MAGTVLCDLKNALVRHEIEYSKDLSELLKIARKTINLKCDDLPLYNRRHIALLVNRLKKHSDKLVGDLNSTQSGSVSMDTKKVYEIINLNSNTSFSLSCVAYMEMLEEFRTLLKRTAPPQDLTYVYSPRLSCERALGPLHRLAFLRNTLRKIVNAESNAKLAETASQTLDIVTSIFDRCCEVLISLHGTNYVTNVDNLLDFSVKLTSLERVKNEGKNGLEVPSNNVIYCSFMEPTKRCSNLSRLSGDENNYDSSEKSQQIERVPSLHLTNSQLESWNNSQLELSLNRLFGIGNTYEVIPMSGVYMRVNWVDIPQVINSGYLGRMNQPEIAFMETKLEILTSEVMYLKSICLAIGLFLNSRSLKMSLPSVDYDTMFNNLIDVRESSKSLLFDLTGEFEKDILLSNVSTVVKEHFTIYFSFYQCYCSALPSALAALTKHLDINPTFREVCKQIEASKEVEGFTLQSFLVLPLLRITNLIALLYLISNQLQTDQLEYLSIRYTIRILQQLAALCKSSVRQAKKEMKAATSSKLSCDEFLRRSMTHIEYECRYV